MYTIFALIVALGCIVTLLKKGSPWVKILAGCLTSFAATIIVATILLIIILNSK